MGTPTGRMPATRRDDPVAGSRRRGGPRPDPREVRRALRTIPNVGRAMAEDLMRLGVRSIADLRRRNPLRMYEEISRLDGQRHDPCVLDTFMAAVDFARTGRERPWWEFTPERRRMMERRAPARPAARRRRR